MKRIAPHGLKQQGSAMMLSIMMMMSLGIIVLSNLGLQLADGVALSAYEHRYLNAREQAESSLNWGLNQEWEASNGQQWLCQQADVEWHNNLRHRLNSCVRPSLREGIFLFKGEGIVAANMLPLIIYRQAKRVNSSGTARRFIALDQGWLDFCPERDPNYCENELNKDLNAKGI